MTKFSLYIQSITCLSTTDSLLEGMEDELYLEVWHLHLGKKVIEEKILLGKFSEGSQKDYYKTIFKGEFINIGTIGFDFYDSDQFSSDDLLGGFMLSAGDELKLGRNTKCFPPQGSELPYFILHGNGGEYKVDASYEAL